MLLTGYLLLKFCLLFLMILCPFLVIYRNSVYILETSSLLVISIQTESVTCHLQRELHADHLHFPPSSSSNSQLYFRLDVTLAEKKKKEVQCESCELNFIQGKMRTIDWETASQIPQKD